MKFEEAKIGKNGQIISINDLLQLSQNNTVLLDVLRHDLYCPVCGGAKLALYLNVSSPFLKTKNGEKHLDTCKLKQPQMTQKECEDFLKTAAPETIEHQMEKLLLLLSNHSQNTNASPTQNNTSTANTNNRENKRIPHKRIDRPLNNDDYDVIKYFYGNVNIRFETVDKYGYSRMNIFSTDNSKIYCSIKITNNVYLHLDRSYIIDQDNVDFVYLGKISRFNNRNYSTAIKSYCILINH